jgi:type I restriction enzyme, S subunit
MTSRTVKSGEVTEVSWKIFKIKDVGHVVTGKTPSTKVAEYFGGSIPFVTPSELDKDNPVMSAHTFLTDLGASEVKLVPRNSVMVCCIGSLGKIGFAGCELATNQQINTIIFDEQIVYPRFGFWFCKTLKPLLEQIAPSTTLPIVNKSRFENLEIPLPPLEQQKHIAAVLAAADALRQKRRESLKKLDELLKSVFLDMFGDPVMNPRGWEERPLKDVADIGSGVAKGRKFDGQETIEVPYMRVANVQDGHLMLDDVKTIEVLPTDVSKYALRKGDILLTEGGDPDKLGRGAIWEGQIKNCIHQNHIFRVRIITNDILPDFISPLIGSQRGKKYFLRAAKQTTGIATINMNQLRSFPILAPPLNLQIAYRDVATKIENEKTRLETSLASLETLFASLQQGVFGAGV